RAIANPKAEVAGCISAVEQNLPVEDREIGTAWAGGRMEYSGRIRPADVSQFVRARCGPIGHPQTVVEASVQPREECVTVEDCYVRRMKSNRTRTADAGQFLRAHRSPVGDPQTFLPISAK